VPDLIDITPARPAALGSAIHPLEPLSAREVRDAVQLLRDSGKVTPTTRFVSVALREPEKGLVHDPNGDPTPPREAFAVLFDNAANACYEATVSLADGVLLGGADAVLAASIFHFGEHTIAEAKALMADRGIVVRPVTGPEEPSR